MLGFKFILPQNFPCDAPLVYLDEPENEEVIEMVDYLDKGNRIMFEFIIKWGQQGGNIKTQLSTYNLSQLLGNIFKLFVQMPPVGFEELFGDDQPAAASGDQWQDANLFKNDSEEIRRANTIQKGIFFDEN